MNTKNKRKKRKPSITQKATKLMLNNLMNHVDTQRDTVIVACSGGADSVALAYLVSKTCHNVVLAHIMHDMRPREEAFVDLNLVLNLSNKLKKDNPNVKFESHNVYINNNKNVNGNNNNVESVARNLRYEELLKIAKKHGANVIVTAHHADDQLETILMKLCKGSGLDGLSGIATVKNVDNCKLIRPLLELSKQNLVDICLQNNLKWVEDATNKDTKYTRAGLRNKVLPILEEYFSNSSQCASRSANLLTDAAGLVSDCVNDLFDNEVHVGDSCVFIAIDSLQGTRDIVIGGLIRKMYMTLMGEKDLRNLTSKHIQKITSAVKYNYNTFKHNLPNVDVYFSKGFLVLAKRKNESS